MRFFFLLAPPGIRKGPWRPPGELRKHLRALRFASDQTFLLLPPDGVALEARLLSRDHIEILGTAEVPSLSMRNITLATAWPKGSRGGDLIVRACESGVRCIQPIVCERSVAGREGFSIKQLERLEKLARETCQQIRQPMPPVLQSEAIPLENPGNRFENSQVICLVPNSPPLSQISIQEPSAELVLVVGPEGGFTDQEIQMMKRRKWSFAGLLPTILRIEAAGPMGAAILQQLNFAPKTGQE